MAPLAKPVRCEIEAAQGRCGKKAHAGLSRRMLFSVTTSSLELGSRLVTDAT